MKKINIVKNVLFTLFSVLFFAFALTLYIQSFENKIESSSKIKFDEKYVIYIILAICCLIVSIYNFVIEANGKEKNPKVFFITSTIGTLVLSLFYLSSFFGALLDYWDREYFVFADNQLSLYIGLTAFVLFLGLVFKYFAEKKNK